MTTIAIIIAAAALISIAALVCVIQEDRVEIRELRRLVKENEDLKKAQAKRMPYDALVDVENVLGAIIGAQTRIDDLTEEAQAFLLRAGAARDRLDKALEIARILRGSNGRK